MFYVTAFLLIGFSTIYFDQDNVIEKKALVPLVTLEDEIDNILGDIVVIARFNYYGGACVEVGNICNSDITHNIDSIKGKPERLSCYLDNETDCVLTFSCKGCEVKSGAYVAF